MDSAPERPYDTHDVPVTATQESLWLADRLSRADGPAYNEPLAFHLAGAVDAEALRSALRHVVARHEALRTGFAETADGLRATVHGEVPDALEFADLSG